MTGSKSGNLSKVDVEQANNIIAACLEMNISPAYLQFLKEVCNGVRELYKSPMIKVFIDDMIRKLDEQGLLGGGDCRGMGFCRGMGYCDGMHGMAPDVSQMTPDDRKNLLDFCVLYNLSPIDLAYILVDCRSLRSMKMKDLDMMKKNITKEIIVPTPPGKKALTNVKASVKKPVIATPKVKKSTKR